MCYVHRYKVLNLLWAHCSACVQMKPESQVCVCVASPQDFECNKDLCLMAVNDGMMELLMGPIKPDNDSEWKVVKSILQLL